MHGNLCTNAWPQASRRILESTDEAVCSVKQFKFDANMLWCYLGPIKFQATVFILGNMICDLLHTNH